MHLHRPFFAAAAVAMLLPLAVAQQDPGSDGDGLSDFHEVHKYLTDPHNADTDGDGVPDGDWRERREYQYTVRSVVRVMRPVTIEHLCDDYQDARILDQTAEYVELEVFHYPYNTVADAIVADPSWRKNAAAMRYWLEPGPTSDWTPELRHALEVGLLEDGIAVARLSDKEVVERAATWLLERAKQHDRFSTFVTAFDAEGRPFVPDDLRGAGELDFEAQWPRAISAKGMFEHRTRGSCSSTAIYLSGCLRARGVPTRTLLVVPIVDADDDTEIAMIERLANHEVRRMALTAARQRRGSWASHTLNEVWVGGRWRRLNYGNLGQNILDPAMFGLVTHVATFRDWADANMQATIGRRQRLQRIDDVFGGVNPYSTIALRDEFGPHCRRANPVPPPVQAKVASIRWGDDPTLPDDVRRWFVDNGRFGLIARIDGPRGSAEFAEFLADADLRVRMVPADGQPLGTAFEAGCWWWKHDHGLILVPIGAGDRRDLVPGMGYVFTPRNYGLAAKWSIPQELRIERPKD